MNKLYIEAELVKELVGALEEIVNPIHFMQERLEEGEQLNGMVAVQLAKDASYLKDIAKAALATYRERSITTNHKHIL